MRRLVALLISLVVCLASATTTTASAAVFACDAPAVSRVGVHQIAGAKANPTWLSKSREWSVSPPAEASGASTTLVSRSVATNTASPWSLALSPRGFAVEEALGGNLPRSFPTIDRFANGAATSIKSVDLTATSYQNAGALASRLTGYVDNVAGFNGATFNQVSITSGQVTSRGLEIAIQPGVATAAQTAALNEVVAYGTSQGVVVRVVTVP